MNFIKRYFKEIIGALTAGVVLNCILFLLDIPGRWLVLKQLFAVTQPFLDWVYEWRLSILTIGILGLLYLLDRIVTDSSTQIADLRQTVADLSLNLNKKQKVLEDVAGSVAFIEYIRKNKEHLDVAIRSYTDAWNKFETFATDTTKWEPSATRQGRSRLESSLWIESINALPQQLNRLKSAAKQYFDHNWSFTAEFPMPTILPDVIHIPDETTRRKYKELWLENEKIKFQIQQLLRPLDAQIHQSEELIKKETLKEIHPKWGIAPRIDPTRGH